MEININCDLGESSKLHSTKNDHFLLNIVNSANIACGYHAGDKLTMEKTIEISKLLRTGKMSDIQVGTTEEFQGTEKDAIIVSTVRSNEQLLNFDARTGLGFVSQKKRTCVTLTR